MKLVAEKVFADEDMTAMNRVDQAHIVTRANELKQKYPDKAAMFDGYIKSQEAECKELEKELTCMTWLLQKMG